MEPARQTRQSIEVILGKLDREEDRVEDLLAAATEAIAEHKAEAGRLYRALAAVRLEALEREGAEAALSAAERKAAQGLARFRAAAGAAAAEHKRLLGEVERLVAEQADRAEALEVAVDRLEDFTEAARARIEDDPRFLEADRAAETAEDKATRADEKAAVAERDREEKRRAYENDPLFMYLWRRQFGTAAYEAMPLVRYFDRKVARLVGFNDARANYRMLNEIPERLRAHASRVKAAAEASRAAAAAVVREALVRDGVAGHEAAVADAEAAVAKVEAALDAAKADLEAARARRVELSDAAADKVNAAALDDLAAAIGRAGLQALREQARATRDGEDDRIVSGLDDLLARQREREAEAARLRDTLRTIAERRARIRESLETFRRGGYDNPRGGFSNPDTIGQVLGGILEGAARSGALDRILRDGFGPRRRSGGFGFPTGGGWGGRAGRYGGTVRLPPMGGPPAPRGGGGFRTGGSF